MLVGVCSGDDGYSSLLRRVVGLVRDASGDVDIIPFFDPVAELKIGPMNEFGDALQHVDGGFVGLVVVSLGTCARRHDQHVHADFLRAYGFSGDSAEIIQALLAMKTSASLDHFALSHPSILGRGSNYMIGDRADSSECLTQAP